jgi:putative phage integrase
MLTDTKIKQAKVTDRPYKLYDAEGLYIEIAPTGSKRWRWRYRWNGKEKLLGFGLYPEISLKRARERRTAAKELLATGVDPSQARKEEKVEARAAENSFAAMAEEWYALYSVPWSQHYRELVRQRLDQYLLPTLGKRALADITPTEIMGILSALEKRGVIETANRVLGICSQIFRRAVATGRAKSDPCRDLRGALAPAQERHHAALTTKEGARAVMRALDAYQGSFVVRAAVHFTALTFVRQVELRFATWDEIDWEGKMWLIPAERMKMRREHMVPLSRQAIAVLEDMRRVNGGQPYIFAGQGRRRRPISENTVRCALQSMGFAGEMTAHGFRSMASTLLNEMGWRSDVIERQLAHVDRNKVRSAYNRAEYIMERCRMMQAWSDFLDSLR